MTRFPRPLRKAVLVTLCLSLLAPWASAAPPRSAPRPEEPGSRAGALVENLRRLVLHRWGKIGLRLDPSGASGSGTTTQTAGGCQGEIGAGIDPNGQCSDGR